jgi:hypothetical protein
MTCRQLDLARQRLLDHLEVTFGDGHLRPLRDSLAADVRALHSAAVTKRGDLGLGALIALEPDVHSRRV